jgi:hypothetical protein
VKKEFVALTINGRVRSFDDDESRFLEKADCGGQGRIDIISASGKMVARGELQVGNPRTHLLSLQRALKAWAALPESERKPAAIKVPKRGPLDARRNAAKGPPPGTLIVRVYNRQLERTPRGKYRHTVPEDYIPPSATQRWWGRIRPPLSGLSRPPISCGSPRSRLEP